MADLKLDVFRTDVRRTLPYQTVLQEVKSHLSANYAHVLVRTIDDKNAAGQVTDLIAKYINDNGIRAEGMKDMDSLVARLYNDLAQYGIITDYISDPAVEEINCNAFDDVEVVYPDGYKKLDETYASPGILQDYAKKIMNVGGITLDESQPVGDGYIGTGIRASAITTPCVDAETGTVLAIRRQRMAGITHEQYLANDTATQNELDLIGNLIRYGISVVFAGSVGSGKTTDMNYFLRLLPADTRIFVIEDTRELNLIKRDAAGRIVSRVIHTKTRYADDSNKNVGMNDLLRMALRFSPQVIVPSEMRGPEAMTAQEAGRTGHTVVTSLHSNSAQAAYRRILTMCNMSGTRINDNLLMDMIVEAFPIIVYKKKLADGTRKFMEIFEADGQENGRVEGHSIFRYQVKDNVYHDGRLLRVEGRHVQTGRISETLAQRMLDAGAPAELVSRYTQKAG